MGLLIGLVGCASGLIMPAQAVPLRAASPPAVSRAPPPLQFAGSSKSAPRKAAKKAAKKVVKKVSVKKAPSASYGGMLGKKTGPTAPAALLSLNIDNYQDWGPVGGVIEAVNLLRGLYN